MPKICGWGNPLRVHSNGSNSFKVDSQCLGLLIFYIYEGRSPSAGRFDFTQKSISLAQDIILKLALEDDQQRLSVQQACHHELFAGIE